MFDSADTPRRVSGNWILWFAFAIVALSLLDVLDPAVWVMLVAATASALALAPWTRVSLSGDVDRRDLAVVAALYVVVVAFFRLAFTVFTTDSVLGLFLAFAAGMLAGVGGPVVYQVWIRGRDLQSLGMGMHAPGRTVVVGLTLAAVQFTITLWGIDLPAAVDWVPLLVMSIVVGLFEAVFFRGFVQNLLERSLGTGPGIALAAALYSVYHVGYGMGLDEIWFLLGLGIVYAIAFRLAGNILVLWPLLTPLGSFYNNLEAGDIELPWASIAGFADVLAVMGVILWLAHRRSVKSRDDAPVLESMG